MRAALPIPFEGLPLIKSLCTPYAFLIFQIVACSPKGLDSWKRPVGGNWEFRSIQMPQVLFFAACFFACAFFVLVLVAWVREGKRSGEKGGAQPAPGNGRVTEINRRAASGPPVTKKSEVGQIRRIGSKR
jgi:hypothetical protein